MELQYELLEKGAELLKPNGQLVYSTCTVEPEENFGVISKFLEKHPEFELVNAKEMLHTYDVHNEWKDYHVNLLL